MSQRKVLVSPGYGAGWSTWADSDRDVQEFMLFDKKLIAAIEAGEDLGVSGMSDPAPDSPLADFVARFKEKFDETRVPYLGGARDLKVETVYGPFKVDEYDGHESITTQSDLTFY